MGERDQVWEYEENLFPRFNYKYCLKEFRGGSYKVEGAFDGKM
jgi:hypothetical protein